MDKIVGEYYVIDNVLFKSDNINYKFKNIDYQFYEVLRTANGTILFLDDHIQRLKYALADFGYSEYFSNNEIILSLSLIIKQNNYREGNIKLLCRFDNTKLSYGCYYIPHSYPPDELYRNGIKIRSLVIERNQPNLKQVQVNEFIKVAANEILNLGDYYEVLLVTQEGIITEGSKSNFFLIKDNVFYSAPENLILKGITRKYVLNLIHQTGFGYLEKTITQKELNNYESAFICGTSPKILPVKDIDGYLFDVNNKQLREIMKKYHELLNQMI
jgi:branched-chain amino acid aminotransferase